MTANTLKKQVDHMLDGIDKVQHEGTLAGIISGIQLTANTHRAHILKLKAALEREETSLIECVLLEDLCKEKLRIVLASKPRSKDDLTDRQREILEFKDRIPGLMKKLEEEDNDE